MRTKHHEIYVPGTKQWDKGYKEGKEIGYKLGLYLSLKDFIDEGIITQEDAAKAAGISMEELQKQLSALESE